MSYLGWDAAKTVLDGQQFVLNWGPQGVEARIIDAHPRRFADPQDDSIFHPRTWHRAARLGWVSFHRLQRGLHGWSWMRPFPRTLRTVATATLQAARPCGVVPFRLRIPTPNGAKWHGQTVRRMIDRAAC